MSNYGSYLQTKSLKEVLSKQFLCRCGGTMCGDINMDCNKITNVDMITFCNGETFDGSFVFTDAQLDYIASELSDNFIATDNSGQLIQDLDAGCNNIIDVSSISFCDGTYIGPGSSFDISTNQVLHVKTNQNIIMDSSEIIIDGRQFNNSGNSVLTLHSNDGDDCLINMVENNVTRWTLRNQGNNGDRFYIQGEGGANNKWFTLEQTSGNCGIGSINPTQRLDVCGNTIIRGELDMDCNQINDVSGINFCDGTYIGPGSSFDISTNDEFKLIQNGAENMKVDMSGNLFLNETNRIGFNDITSVNQGFMLPTIQQQPVSLERISVFTSNISYTIAQNATEKVRFTTPLVNQMNLSISGGNNEIISPSIDISGQLVEIYLNVEFNGGNNSDIQFDISSVAGPDFREQIDHRTTRNDGTHYLTFGPHIFIPSEWSGSTTFNFLLTNTDNDTVTVQNTKIVLKSRVF